MASAIEWPLDLPQLADLSVEDVDTRLFSETDVGPAKVRRRYSFVPRVIEARLALTAHQAVEFVTFYNVTLKGGTLTFNWEDPQTDERVELFFKKRGKLAQHRGGAPADRAWFVDVTLEVRGAA